MSIIEQRLIADRRGAFDRRARLLDKTMVLDRRTIIFSAGSIVEIVGCSWHIARKIGLPAVPPEDVRFDMAADTVTLLYGIHGQPLPIDKSALGALLINYCLRAKIRIPRKLDRLIQVRQDAVCLVFQTTYPTPVKDLAAERAEKDGLMNAVRWS